MCHGRAAVVVQALSRSGARPSVAKRARQRLLADIRAALRGRAVAGWPREPAVVAGTLALACRAGLPLAAELRALVAATPELTGAPWHAAAIVGAVAIILAGLATVWRGPRWPVMSARFDRPGQPRRPRAADSATMWESLSRDLDPTVEDRTVEDRAVEDQVGGGPPA